MMDADEREIYYYLKGWRGQFLSPREICRRAAGKKRFQESPDWAKPILLRMVDKGILETDASGYFRLKPIQKRDKRQKWVSPQMARILRDSGKDFSEALVVNEDDYYENL
jgi:hypothetical protein